MTDPFRHTPLLVLLLNIPVLLLNFARMLGYRALFLLQSSLDLSNRGNQRQKHSKLHREQRREGTMIHPCRINDPLQLDAFLSSASVSCRAHLPW